MCDILINKENKLDKNYIPNNLISYINKNNNKILLNKIVLDDFLKLQRYCEDFKFYIDIEEGYRSYDMQEIILNDCINEKGSEHAYKYVALPGESEHQSGLAIDISIYIDDKFYYEHDMYDLKELKLLHDIIHKFGFILRYLKGKEYITKYNYEPWHLRYVGKDIAYYIYNNNITLEEYKKLG